MGGGGGRRSAAGGTTRAAAESTLSHRRIGLISLAVLAAGGLPLWRASRPSPKPTPSPGVALAAPSGAATAGATVSGTPGTPGAPVRAQAAVVSNATAALDGAAAGSLRRRGGFRNGSNADSDGGRGGGGWGGEAFGAYPGTPAPESMQVLVRDVPLRSALTLLCDAAQVRYRFGAVPQSAPATGAATATPETADGPAPAAPAAPPVVEAPEEAGQESVSLWTGEKPLPLAAVLYRLSQSSPTRRPFRLEAVGGAPPEGGGAGLAGSAPLPMGGGDTEIVVGGPRQASAPAPAPAATPEPGGRQGAQQRKRPERRMAGVVLSEGKVVCALIETRTSSSGGAAAAFYELARPGRRLAQASMGAPVQFVTAVHPDRVEVRNVRTGATSTIPFVAACGDVDVPPALAAVLGSAAVSGAEPSALNAAEIDSMIRGGFGSGGGFSGGGFGGGFGGGGGYGGRGQ